MPSHLSSSVIMRSQEEKKQKPIGPNWQDGTTLSGTCYAKLLKNRCFPRYFLPLDASEFPLDGQYIEEPTLQKSVFFAIPCLSYLGATSPDFTRDLQEREGFLCPPINCNAPLQESENTVCPLSFFLCCQSPF